MRLAWVVFTARSMNDHSAALRNGRLWQENIIDNVRHGLHGEAQICLNMVRLRATSSHLEVVRSHELAEVRRRTARQDMLEDIGITPLESLPCDGWSICNGDGTGSFANGSACAEIRAGLQVTTTTCCC